MHLVFNGSLGLRVLTCGLTGVASNEIEKTEPPALPYPEPGYSPSFFQQFNNVLRLYFNRLTSSVNQLLSTDDGSEFYTCLTGLFIVRKIKMLPL